MAGIASRHGWLYSNHAAGDSYHGRLNSDHGKLQKENLHLLRRKTMLRSMLVKSTSIGIFSRGHQYMLFRLLHIVLFTCKYTSRLKSQLR